MKTEETINSYIQNLTYDKQTFLQRQKQLRFNFDVDNSSFEDNFITYQVGFVRTETYAVKRIVSEVATFFRDFKEPDYVKIAIPLQIGKSIKMYNCQITRVDFEHFWAINFNYLRADIKRWREEWSELSVNKNLLVDFAVKFIKIL